MLTGISKSQLAGVLEDLAVEAKAKEFDASIKEVMESNLKAKRKDEDE